MPSQPMAGRELAQTKDVMLLILGHLDGRDMTPVLSTDRAFLWLGHDILGGRKHHSQGEVLALDSDNVGSRMAPDVTAR